EPPQARPLLPDAASRPLSPRDSNWTGLTSTPRVDPSPRQSEARLQETPPEGLREVDREILEQLRALSEAVKAISTTSTPGSTAEKQQTVDQLDAKRAAEAKKRLLSASCMALGVKDDRLLLVDCFLSWSHAWQSSKEAPKDTTSTRDVAAQAEDRSPASHLPEEAPAEDPSGPVLPVLADHALRALLGEEVWLDPDGSLHGASLWLSMTPPQVRLSQEKGVLFLVTANCLATVLEVPSAPSAASAPCLPQPPSRHAPLALASSN
ncbi:rio2, partial [Symbiodinium microadriaticum]